MSSFFLTDKHILKYHHHQSQGSRTLTVSSYPPNYMSLKVKSWNFYPPSWSTGLSFLTESNLNYIFQLGGQKSISKLCLLLHTGIRKNNIVISRLFYSPLHIVKTFIFHIRRRVRGRQKLKIPQNRLAVYPDLLSCLCSNMTVYLSENRLFMALQQQNYNIAIDMSQKA